ncbi:MULTISPECIES: hypothetical protein [unclassified Nodularia (in: cyanobacteria)]|uniref:hypothetical protein n=1 Tax=unclassified Nodularia (in: cyanobacteria) TaxID=2656917 RepID=UPI0018801397|nr:MULTISPECIES: hypothetical protein [unclassified Nodularia (in: cyanobacteria)]MBE9199076.1 hypothetical protein [Nodularia sp. LEGE 06071]MCC2694078.1 hypothetical protein [Nodularia sp. LEGE 04288]
MNHLPWIVYSSQPLLSVDQSPLPGDLSRIVAGFGTRPEAEMHAQSLNRLAKSSDYKVCFNHQAQPVN